ncbi:MAG: hypothetical protein ACXWVJ_01035 [Caulobacteraceae bacterium]
MVKPSTTNNSEATVESRAAGNGGETVSLSEGEARSLNPAIADAGIATVEAADELLPNTTTLDEMRRAARALLVKQGLLELSERARLDIYAGAVRLAKEARPVELGDSAASSPS